MKKVVLVLAAVSLLLLGACGGDEPNEPTEATEESATEEGHESEGNESADVTGETEFELEVDDFYFEPATLTGDPGQTLTLIIHNEGDAAHTFTAEDLDIDEELQPGDEVEVEVTYPDEATVIGFICRFHTDQGMHGALEVAN